VAGGQKARLISNRFGPDADKLAAKRIWGSCSTIAPSENMCGEHDCYLVHSPKVDDPRRIEPVKIDRDMFEKP
jgi:hypothetical protein